MITYGLFDMSYDGDYMDIPPNEQPLSDEEKLEINNAVEEMRRWTFRTDEEWMREFLIQIVTGSKTYDDLPDYFGGARYTPQLGVLRVEVAGTRRK